MKLQALFWYPSIGQALGLKRWPKASCVLSFFRVFYWNFGKFEEVCNSNLTIPPPWTLLSSPLSVGVRTPWPSAVPRWGWPRSRAAPHPAFEGCPRALESLGPLAGSWPFSSRWRWGPLGPLGPQLGDPAAALPRGWSCLKPWSYSSPVAKPSEMTLRTAAEARLVPSSTFCHQSFVAQAFPAYFQAGSGSLTLCSPSSGEPYCNLWGSPSGRWKFWTKLRYQVFQRFGFKGKRENEQWQWTFCKTPLTQIRFESRRNACRTSFTCSSKEPWSFPPQRWQSS